MRLTMYRVRVKKRQLMISWNLGKASSYFPVIPKLALAIKYLNFSGVCWDAIGKESLLTLGFLTIPMLTCETWPLYGQ